MSSLIDIIFQFFNTFYLDPLRNDSGYNPVNTFTWAIVLGISLLGVIKLLNKLEKKITPRLIAAVMTFVLAGSSLRVIEDAHIGIINPPLGYLLITPNIYFLVFAINIIFLWISMQLQRAGLFRIFHLVFAVSGLLWFIVNLFILLHFEHMVYAYVSLFVIVAGSGLTYVFYMIARSLGSSMFTNPLNLSILMIHLMDASATYIGVDKLGYFSKHVAPSFLIKLTGTALVMYPLKLFVFVLIKMTLLILGFLQQQGIH